MEPQDIEQAFGRFEDYVTIQTRIPPDGSAVPDDPEEWAPWLVKGIREGGERVAASPDSLYASVGVDTETRDAFYRGLDAVLKTGPYDQESFDYGAVLGLVVLTQRRNDHVRLGLGRA
jgi:hypothetical protein